MPHEVFTQPWAQALVDELRGSDAYRQAATNWEGSILLAMAGGTANTHAANTDAAGTGPAIYLDLHRGECRAGRLATDEDREQADFVLAADLDVWRRVLEQDLEPIFGVMSGKLRLERGSLAKLVPHVNAARELVAAAGRLESVFPTP